MPPYKQMAGIRPAIGSRHSPRGDSVQGNHRVRSTKLLHTKSASADAYEKRRLSQSDRLLLMFDRHRLHGADGPVDTEPEPEGLSGSGVWRITSDPATDRLTAVIEAHTESGKLIYAARFGILVRSLEEYAAGRLA